METAFQAAALPHSAALQSAAAPQDSTPELLHELVQHMSASAQSGSTAEDQSQVIASQAAALASARQAMRLMLRLLESGADVSQLFAAGAQTARHAASTQPALVSAASLQDVLSQLLDQASPPAAQPEVEDQAALLTEQAAELASARQAMQLMLQLLEQQQGDAGASELGVQPLAKHRQSTRAVQADTSVVQHDMQQALSHALEQLTRPLPAQPHMLAYEQVSISGWPRSLHCEPVLLHALWSMLLQTRPVGVLHTIPA